MSKHKDYTRYSNRERRTETKLMEEAQDQVANTEFETPAPVAEEQVFVEQLSFVEPTVEPKKGVVTDCLKLNVRKEPNSEAEVIGQITAATKLVVYENESEDEFYKICTYSGIEGYCMKKFISIIP